MNNLSEFLKEQGIIVEHGVLKFKDKRKRSKLREKWVIPKQTPEVIQDIIDVLVLLDKYGISLGQIDRPVLVAIIQRYLGYSRKWSFIIANALIRIWILT